MSGGVPAGEFVAMVSRLTHTVDDDWSPCSFDDAIETLDSLIAKAREIQSTPTPPIEGRDADVERECQAVWRCAIGDAVGAMDLLRTEWINSRRKHEREAGAKLGAVLDLVWASRGPAAGSYKQAFERGNALIARVRAALQALGERP